MSPIAISAVVFVCVFGGALLGILIHFLLKTEHITPESKEAVRLAMGLVATTVALVLGLLIASAKGFYDIGNTEMTELAANIVFMDRILAHYGPEAQQARAELRTSVEYLVNSDASNSASAKTRFDPGAAGQDALYERLQGLSPGNENQRHLQAQALDYATRIGHTRWLMFEQKTTPLPTPLLGMLVFWLTLLFISFGMFVRPNAVVVASLFLAALALAGAVFLIVEMYQPYGGFIQVSDAPLRAALAQLGRN
jgi:hypothetical protein